MFKGLNGTYRAILLMVKTLYKKIQLSIMTWTHNNNITNIKVTILMINYLLRNHNHNNVKKVLLLQMDIFLMIKYKSKKEFFKCSLLKEAEFGY